MFIRNQFKESKLNMIYLSTAGLMIEADMLKARIELLSNGGQ